MKEQAFQHLTIIPIRGDGFAGLSTLQTVSEVFVDANIQPIYHKKLMLQLPDLVHSGLAIVTPAYLSNKELVAAYRENHSDPTESNKRDKEYENLLVWKLLQELAEKFPTIPVVVLGNQLTATFTIKAITEGLVKDVVPIGLVQKHGVSWLRQRFHDRFVQE